MNMPTPLADATDTLRTTARHSRDALADALGLGTVDDTEALRRVMSRFDTAMLLTNLDAVPCGRPMQVAAFDDVGMWFVTDAQSPKVYEITNDQAAVVTLQGTGLHAVIRGHAELRHDPDRLKALWSPVMDAWFPGGPAGSNAVLVCFVPHSGQYWNLRGTKGLRFAAHLAEALATGGPVRPVDGAEGSAVFD